MSADHRFIFHPICVKRLFTILFTLCLAWGLPARAQIALSDSLEISLLTCSPGPDAYERFGHTGIRLHDLKGGGDYVFHYGVFSFRTPDFIYRFVKGETDYCLGLTSTDRFVKEYRERGLGMTEQVLWLTRLQQQELLRRFIDNYRPENRTYRYSYFFDNCATRPYRIIEASTDGLIRYDSAAWMRPVTLRQLVAEKVCPEGDSWRAADNWLYFGISLCVAGRADRRATMVEQLFLPDHLELAYLHASIDYPTATVVGDSTGLAPVTLSRPLVRESRTLLSPTPEILAQLRATEICSPMLVCGTILALAILVTAVDVHTRRRRDADGEILPQTEGCCRHIARTYLPSLFDCLLLLLTGLAGVMIWFLNFFSLHPAVDHNWNCLWLLPTNVIFAMLIWLKSLQKVRLIYFFIIFAALIVYLIATALFVDQYVHPAFIPLILALMVRSLGRIGTTIA